MFLILSLSLKTTDVSNVNTAQNHPRLKEKEEEEAFWSRLCRKGPDSSISPSRRRGRLPRGERQMPSLWLWIFYLSPLLPLRDPREPFFESKLLGSVFLRRKKNGSR